ncbi:hypothetical protein E6H26_06075 [Candidatus Bathyarchaeota archaeon]|nr:MAG: hypothetical protein E6H26_06075 [Candidatus Bathyarchaeota archaeon]
MKVANLVVPLVLLAALSLLGPVSPAAADRGPRMYQFLVGSGLLCDLAPDACPDISMASNGDTVSVSGGGTFSLAPFGATGTGSFIHKSASGDVRAEGSWVVLRLLAFHSFGDATPLVQLQVNGTPVFNAILNVDCELGTPPPGQSEGFAVSVQNAVNFNKKLSGFTVFIRT